MTNHIYKENDPVLVQLGPNIEEAVIAKIKGSRITVTLKDSNSVDVDVSKIAAMDKPEEQPVVADITASEISAAFAVPSLDREVTEEEANLYVIDDEWHGQLERGDPFWEAAEPYIRANPGQHFRYLGAPTVRRHGNRGYEHVIDRATGKPVQVSGMTLARIPKHVHEERVRQVNKRTDEQDASRQSGIKEQIAEAGKEAGIGTQMLDAFETARVLRDGMSGKDFRPKR